MRRIKIVDILQATIGRISTNSLMGYSDDRDIADLDGKDFVSKDMVVAAVAASVQITTGTGSYEYTLSSPERTLVNALGKWPNFVALVGGQQFYDVYPQYTGTPGSFTQIKVQLHSDSEVHVLQFS